MTELLAGRRVLVVEDEMMVLLNIESMLADLGCETISVAATVESALALVDAERFDCAMLDVNLGGQTSYPIADVLVARSIPFVFSTGYDDHRIPVRFGDKGVLKKPYGDEELAIALVQMMSAATPVPANVAK